MDENFYIIDDYSKIKKNRLNENIVNFKVVLNLWNKLFYETKNSRLLDFSDIINRNEIIKLNYQFLPNISEIIEWQSWYDLYTEDRKKHEEIGHNFNVFSLFKEEFDFHVKEIMHSKLLKFLLNPFSSHGQGNKFLIEFLNLIGIQNPNDGTWFVTAEEGRIDVLLKRNHPHSVVIIENKSNWAGDQPNQLYRYWLQEIYSTTKEANFEFYENNKDKYQILYLPPNESKQYEQQSVFKPTELTEVNLPDNIPLRIKTIYFNKEIQIWLENCKIQLPEKNHRIREYISQYKSLCNNL
jgi:hypothetical protein